MEKNDVSVIDKIGTEKKEVVKQPAKWAVVLHNDDYTHAEFVVILLSKVFKMDVQTAMGFMFSIHQNGSGVAGIYSREVAEVKHHVAMDLAKEYGHPLLLTIEEV